ncbi:MAG: TonB-dependent receptor [Bacteroidales bacterium]|nr:TonB-dependent receptor [Bacteroidales bacterium]
MRYRLGLLLVLCTVWLWPLSLWGQTVSGTVTDAQTGETLIGATVVDMASGKGTVTNAYGRYTLTLKAASADLRVTYIGYQPHRQTVSLEGNSKVNVALEPALELEEVTITAERMNSPKVSQMSAIEVPVEQIKLVPVMFGEADVLKAVQLLPGVQSGTEGTSGIYVRGGGPDENLFLLDGIPLYNVNHLGGFFSAFNSDALKNVTLYKGSFPAHFTGRISSVLDITTNNGNDKEWHGGATLGLLAAKVSVEGPVIKEKTTLSLSARRTYGDLLIQPILMLAASQSEGLKNLSAGYYFYDLNAKVTHRFSDRSRLYGTFYMGDDKLFLRAKMGESGDDSYNAWLKLGYNWGNLATAVRWNYELSPRLFMNLSGSYTRYRNDLSLGTEDEMHYGYHMSQLQTSKIEMDYNSGIHDLTARADFDYTPAPEHSIHFGTWMTHHIFTPEVLGAKLAFSDTDTTVSQDTTFGQSRVRAQEMVLYAEDDWALTDALKINAGVALSGFAVQGVFYPSVQPRLSGRFMVTDDISVKAGYSYMTQYLHLLSSSNISLPTDLWVPVTARIAPMNSRQVALGVFYDWRSLVNFSIEGYYKNMDNLMEYKPGSSFFGTSSNWEDKVCLGRGWAYGVEFLAQKSVGNLTGWLGYTWSRTWRQFDELNDGAAFPAKYDRIHDLSLTLQYRPNDRFDCGLTWVYSTGNTATLAYHRFETEAPEDVYYYPSSAYFVEQRNNYRLPAYHRMDLSFNFHRKFTRGSRTINVSVYNAYNRQNPFIIYPSTKYYSSDGSEYKTVLMQRSLFPILPSVSYTYKF